MKKPFFTPLLAAVVLFFSMCSQSVWEKTENGVIINLKPANKDIPRKIKLEVVNDDIIHILAVPAKEFSEEKSLCVIDQKPVTPAFTVKQVMDTLNVSTGRIITKISLVTGQVIFCDKSGKTILSEKSGGGKSFSPISVEGTSGYTITQIFDSPDDEAFYGLGQHQSDEFNYKGLKESLYQYNTKVSIPVVVSSRNYGLLWDNYSLSGFGDPRDYSQIDLFNLFDKDGLAGGITASYYISSDTSKALVERRETSIDYETLVTRRNFPEKFPFHRSTVIWKGYLEPRESGLYFFKLYYAGYVKLYLDGELVVPERWRASWNPNTYKFNTNLEKGHRYQLKIEWKPDGGASYIGLKALSPGTPGEKGSLTLFSEMGDQIDYYFIRGNSLDDVISGYRTLTGKAPIMPKWALGYWQSRERYRSQHELLEVINEYRNRNIPLDNIVLDWSYWPVDSWGSHEFDQEFFPDPSGMVDSVHKLNSRIMISVWPKFYYTTGHYKEFDRNGWMYTQAVKDSIRDWIGKGYIGSFYDAYSQGARELFWEQIREHLFTRGFDAWWMDASEPDIQSNASIEYRKLLTTPTAMGPSTKYFNTYPLVNAMAIYNGQKSTDPGKRVFLLTRSGFAGLQRYSTATWSGDIGSRWEDMKAQIPAGLNFSLSGIPYWTFDIGGFSVENRYVRAKEGSEDLNEWRELYTRWFQFGSFCPLFRSHGQYPYREIYNIAPEGSPAYESMVYFDKLRYYLIPYIYSLAGLTYFNDYTIMRAMVMDFGSDRTVRNIGDQYLFGPSLLVAPVYQYKARTRDVYFPSSCGWYDFYTGIHILGGHKLKVDAPFERIPLFIREGSIIPVGPAIQFTDEKPADPLTLYIYTGRDCAFTLYEDEGINYNYEKGECSTIKFTYNEEAGELTLGERRGEFKDMLKKRVFNIIWITKNNHIGFDPDIVPHDSVSYSGKKIIVRRSEL
jgi:alpha-D-xyloside xylohydrolase